MASNSTSVDCVPGALPGGLTRTSFFNGMFLTQSDLEVEQRFWRMKRRLTNRALGHGVVWGLRVTFDGQTQKFTVNPGYGIDCCGNDLVVQAAFETKAGQLIDVTDPAIQALLPNPQGGNEVALVLEYTECPEEPRPVHKDACTPEGDACHTARVRETARLTVAALPSAPKSPVVDFLAGLDKLKKDLAKQGNNALVDVFPDSATQAQQARPLPFKLRVLLGGEEAMIDAGTLINQGQGQQSLLPLSETINYAKNQDPPAQVQLHFELVPDPGFVFYKGAVNQGSNVGGDIFQLLDPFDVRLAWSAAITLPPVMSQDQLRQNLNFTVANLGFAPLFANKGQRQYVTQFEIGVDVNIVPGYTAIQNQALPGQSYHVTVGNVQLMGSHDANPSFNLGTDLVTDDPLSGASCLDPLRSGFSVAALKNPTLAPKTMMLAAVYAWLANSFDPAKGFPQGTNVTPAQFDGQRLLATWIYLTAWRLLFGADAAAPATPDARKKLADLLDSLMAQWCDGFLYTGPRCPAEFHGVVLGTATVDKNGFVLGFDLWQGRRWVLTGPLLNHWAAQVGLAPLDVVVGRFVRAVCCVGMQNIVGATKATMALPPLSPADAPIWTWQLENQEQNPTYDTQNNLNHHVGTFLSDGAMLLFGRENELQAIAQLNGLNVVKVQTLSWERFVLKLVDALRGPRNVQQTGNQPKTPPPPTSYVAYLVDGLNDVQPALVVVSDPHEPGDAELARKKVRAFVRDRLEDFIEAAPKSEQYRLIVRALEDFLTEVLFDIPISVLQDKVKAIAGADTDATFSSLASMGLGSVGDVVALGIEELSQRIGTDSHDATLIVLFGQIDAYPWVGQNGAVTSLLGALALGVLTATASWPNGHGGQPLRRRDFGGDNNGQYELMNLVLKQLAGFLTVLTPIEALEAAGDRTRSMGPNG